MAADRQQRRAFTLVELLVVVAIIGILMSLAFPSLTSAIQRSRALECRANLRQIVQGMMIYAGHYRDVLPATNNTGTEPWQGRWAGSEILRPGDNLGSWGTIPGVLEPLLGTGTMRRLVRCRALPEGQLRSGIGSNGRFDYSMLVALGGARLGNVRSQSRLAWPDGRSLSLPSPLLVEEDPYFNINRSNTEIYHGATDRLGLWHRGTGHYASVDGSVQTLDLTETVAGNRLGPQANYWFMVAPSGTEKSLGTNYGYGGWNRQ